MASRRTSREDDDTRDVIGATAVDEPDEFDDEPDEPDDADFDAELAENDLGGDELDGALGDDIDEPAELPDEDEAADDDELEAAPQNLPAGSEFDDDAVTIGVIDRDDLDDATRLRDGEFICRSCYMAKRESALANRKRMLCRDCA